jgi:hypothetical protein
MRGEKGPKVALQAEDYEVIDAVIAFANLHHIGRQWDAEKHFSKLIDFRDKYEVERSFSNAEASRRGKRSRKAVEQFNRDHRYVELHADVRAALFRMAASVPAERPENRQRSRAEIQRARREVRDELNPILAYEMDYLGYFFTPSGELRLARTFNSVKHVCVYGLALIADEQRHLNDRLHQCALIGCGKFVLKTTPEGQIKFCSEEHRSLADRQRPPSGAPSPVALRVRRLRDKRRREREEQMKRKEKR